MHILPDPHRHERNRRLRRSVSVALFLKPLALLSPLVTSPLLIKYLTPEGFGLFQAVIGLSMLLSLSNVGLQQGLINRLIDCHVSGDRAMARRHISSLMFTLGFWLAVISLIWTAVALLTPWGRVFKLEDARAAAAVPWVALITGVATLLGLFFGLPLAVYTAYQENAIAYLWDGAAKIATFIAIVGVVYTRFGLIGVAVATCAVPVVVGVINTFVLFHQRPWLRPRWADFDRTIVRSTLGDGISMFLLQLAVIAMFQCDKFIIGWLVSPAAVTPYSLLAQLYVIAYGLLWVLLGPLTPAHGEAYRRGDIRWIRRAVRLSLLAGTVLIAGCSAVLLLFGNLIFRRWTRGEITEISRGLVLSMMALFLIRNWLECRAAVLNPANIFRPQMQFFVANVLLNLVLALAVAKPFGVLGVAWATPIAALLTTAWGYPWMLHRALKRRAQDGAVPTAGTPQAPNALGGDEAQWTTPFPMREQMDSRRDH
jgi:O-antigen/teichoic acid export membrane protein